MEEPDQQAVIRGLRNGQQDSWTALYDGYSADLWRYVARLIGSSSGDIADVVQETFLAAARSARQFDPERGTLWAWLTGIAHHHVSLYWRQTHKRSRLMELVESRALELSYWIEGRDELIDLWERQELVDLVRATLGQMSADYASVLTAKYLDDQSLDEIAAKDGGSTDAIKSKLARARREFRTRFERITREHSRDFDETKPQDMKLPFS